MDEDMTTKEFLTLIAAGIGGTIAGCAVGLILVYWLTMHHWFGLLG